MSRIETHMPARTEYKTRAAKDTETMVGNGLATLLAIGTVALMALGLLVGFDVINTDQPFDNGMLWLISSIPAGLAANVFRREHHILDEDEVRRV